MWQEATVRRERKKPVIFMFIIYAAFAKVNAYAMDGFVLMWPFQWLRKKLSATKRKNTKRDKWREEKKKTRARKETFKVYDGIEGSMWYCWSVAKPWVYWLTEKGERLKCNMNEMKLIWWPHLRWMDVLWTCGGCQQFKICLALFFPPHCHTLPSTNGNEDNYVDLLRLSLSLCRSAIHNCFAFVVLSTMCQTPMINIFSRFGRGMRRMGRMNETINWRIGPFLCWLGREKQPHNSDKNVFISMENSK